MSILGTFDNGTGAEIVAYDPLSARIFITTGDAIEIVDISNPENPTLITSFDISEYGDGVNSVAVQNGIVAIAVEVTEDTRRFLGTEETEEISTQTNGKVVFIDTNGNYLNDVEVGVLPDMLTFTPDGTKVLTANEGEPPADYGDDPEGSISIIDLSDGVENATVQTANFNAFDAFKDQLIAQGVKLFGVINDGSGTPSTVSQDLEPEYIAISPDGTKAWVTLQENNAVAIVDIATATVEEIVPLGFKDYNAVKVTNLETFVWDNLPTIGTTEQNQDLFLGGFSGLFYEGINDTNGNLQFITHTDRGPNGEATGGNRPFLLPDFSPEIVRFELDRNTGEIKIIDRINIKQADGSPITGLPNLSVDGGTDNTPYQDETPVDLNGDIIAPLDFFGADLEGIVVNPADGTFWMVDEYRPAIYHFNTDGTLIDRFVPQGTGVAAGGNAGDFGIEALPAVLAQRRQNRGFEAVALNTDTGKLYAFMQSPLRNPETLSNGTLNNSQNIRIVEFDVATETVTAEYLYRLDNPNLGTTGNTRPDKIGDAVYIGNGEFLLVERDDDAIDSDPLSNIEKKVYRFNLGGATNILGQDEPLDLGNGVSKTVDQMTPAELSSQGINPIKKLLHVDLAQAGYNNVEKVEGLAIIDANTIAVLNDNDFQVAGITINEDGTFTPDPDPEAIVLGLITTKPLNGFDASNRDDGINIQNWPVLGLYQPDAIAVFEADGKTYYITANEGDARIRPDGDDFEDVGFAEGDIFNEEVRIKDIELDPLAFPNAEELQEDENLGRLKITTALGDTDGDGDYDQLYAYGSRSFTIWDEFGNLVFDSGDQLEKITALYTPELFNANDGDPDEFDDRSDDKGPEPEAVVVGEIDGTKYAFIGLERAGGGVLIYDLTNPTSPQFINYLRNDGDIAPEGLAFISAEDSPNGEAILAVANEETGTTTLYELNDAVLTPPIELIYAIDISDSSLDKFKGDPVGDLNNDGYANTRLDAQISALKQVTDELLGTVKLGILTYADGSNNSDGKETIELATFLIDDDDLNPINTFLEGLEAEEFNPARNNIDPWANLFNSYGLAPKGYDGLNTDGLTNPDSALDRIIDSDFFSLEFATTKMIIFAGAGSPNLSGDGDGEGKPREYLWRQGYNARALQFESELEKLPNVEILGLNFGKSNYLNGIDSEGIAEEYDNFDSLLQSGRLDSLVSISDNLII